MKKIAMFVFNGDPMCFIHVLLNALDMKENGYEGRIVIEGAATKLIPELAKKTTPCTNYGKKLNPPGWLTVSAKPAQTRWTPLGQQKSKG